MNPRVKIAAALLLTLLPVLACGKKELAPVAHEPSAPVADVRTTTVGSGELPSETWVPGTVYARERATLAARLPAAVVELPLRQGESFRRGDLLVRLDDSAVRAAVTAAQAGLQAAESDLARMKALQIKDAATPREVEQAEAHAAALRAQLQAARDQLTYSALKAPFDGRVTSRLVHVGDVVGPGLPLLEIEGVKGLEIRATVDGRQARRIEVGDTLKVMVDDMTAPLQATVRALSPGGDPATHRFEMRADLDESESVRSGLFARIALPDDSSPPSLTVPSQSLVRRGGLTGVYVVSEGRAHLRWIAIGQESGGLTEVRAGLQADESVVLDPSGLFDGAPVREVAS